MQLYKPNFYKVIFAMSFFEMSNANYPLTVTILFAESRQKGLFRL